MRRKATDRPIPISLVVDIGQGAGLSGATGVRPFLPPLLAGALARGDLGIDFDGTDWRFLESPGFLLAVFALAVLSYGAERSAANRGTGSDTETAVTGEAGGRGPLEFAFLGLAVLLGGLLFAGSMAAEGHAALPGFVAGVACAALAYAAVGGLFERARRRLEQGAAALLVVYAEGIALGLAAVAVFLSPLSYVALVAFVLLLVTGGRGRDRKYAGLRILR